jgi:putative heme iron utilization protein
MVDKPSPIRPTDADARRLARTLARGARFGAIAVLEPESANPFASRVLLGTDVDGVPVMIGSQLSTHTKALLKDPRCSILVGEPGKGDPLAWPRLTILATAERVATDSESHTRIRRRFLQRHAKAKLYVDFPDFSFFKLNPSSASLNGGFGKAYILEEKDLVISSPLNDIIACDELQAIDRIIALGKAVPDLLAKRFFKEKSYNWRISGLDAAGLELARKEALLRLELDETPDDLNALIGVYSKILK